MKVGVWIREHHEVLYDKLTDEVVFREIKKDEPLIIRVPFMDIYRARIKAWEGARPDDPPPASQRRGRRKA